MKLQIYLLICCIFLCKFSNAIISYSCFFQYGSNSGEFGKYGVACLCGPEKQPFGYENNKYCCVKDKDTCEVKESTKWCPNATALYDYQPCSGTCAQFGNVKETKCPSNPDYCMDKGKPFSGCNGHQRCEEYCSGPIEQFLYYNNTKQKNPEEVSAQDTKDKVSRFM